MADYLNYVGCNVSIEPVSNGFIVCAAGQKTVFTSKQKMLDRLSEALDKNK